MCRNAKTTVCMRFLLGTYKFQRLSQWGLFSMRPSHLFPAILPQEAQWATATSPSNQSSAHTDTHPNTRFSAGLCNTMCTPSCVTIISSRKQIWTYWLMLQPNSLAQEHFHSFSALFFIFYTYISAVIISWYLGYIRPVLCRWMRVKPIWIETWRSSFFFSFPCLHLHP